MDLINNPKPNKEIFELICKEIDKGVLLNLHHIGLIFGQSFWELLILVQTNIDIKSNEKINITINCNE